LLASGKIYVNTCDVAESETVSLVESLSVKLGATEISSFKFGRMAPYTAYYGY